MIQTILGAGGQIGTELARELHNTFTADIRLVSRNPKRMHDTDEIVAANIMDPRDAERAVAGSDITYVAVGLPPNGKLWAEQFPTMLTNIIDACEKHHSKLVYFDNTYMYPKSAVPQDENTPFDPRGQKAVARARTATLLLEAMRQDRVEAVICRAPEFYGPGKTQSVTNTLVFDRIARGKKPRIPLSSTTRRSLIWTPDASRAMALIGNTPSVYGRTWHLPVDIERPTYAELIELCEQTWERPLPYTVVRRWQFRLAALISAQPRELMELLPRYATDNIFLCDAFTATFPHFRVTPFREGVQAIAAQGFESPRRE